MNRRSDRPRNSLSKINKGPDRSTLLFGQATRTAFLKRILSWYEVKVQTSKRPLHAFYRVIVHCFWHVIVRLLLKLRLGMGLEMRWGLAEGCLV